MSKQLRPRTDTKNRNKHSSQSEEDRRLRKKFPKWDTIKAKRGSKDSVFTDLFSDTKYLLELYKCLFPNDTSCTEKDFEILTLKNILLTGSYNDLGFLVKGKLLILIEAQSSWNPNIPMRILNYVSQSYTDYQIKHKLNIYGSKLEKYPFPEFYVIYTGKPLFDDCKKLHLKDCFMETNSTDEVPLDCIVNLIDITNSSGILMEYISFCTIYNDMIKKYGYIIDAIEETIRICMNNNILKSYLESRRPEVTRILTQTFEQEIAVRNMVQALENEQQVIQDKLDDTKNKLDDTKNKLDDTKNKLDDAKNKLDDTKNKLDDTKNKLDDTKKERDTARQERDSAVRKFIALCFEVNFSEKEVISRVSKEFNISYEESQSKIRDYKTHKE